MTRFRNFTVAALAAATVAAGSLASTPSASAMPMSCAVRVAVAETYIATGNVFHGLGAYQQASYWYGRARGIMDGC